MQAERSIDVVCLVLVDGVGRVFAARRPPGKSLGGMWEFPGGKIDPGETAEQALRRELREELEMEVGELEPLEVVTHEYDFATIRLWPMLARCDGGNHPAFVLHEHTQACWVGESEARDMEWAPADVPVLGRLLFDGDGDVTMPGADEDVHGPAGSS